MELDLRVDHAGAQVPHFTRAEAKVQQHDSVTASQEPIEGADCYAGRHDKARIQTEDVDHSYPFRFQGRPVLPSGVAKPMLQSDT